MQAPLLVGCDVRNITAETFEIIGNKEVIDINQGKTAWSLPLSLLDGGGNGKGID